MPARLTLADAQARVNTQGKKIRILSWVRPKEVATAECLICGEIISCKGSTLLDKRCTSAGCVTCGELAQRKGRRRYTKQKIIRILEERFPHLVFTGITDSTYAKSDTRVEAFCPSHGDLGFISLWQLISPSKGSNPCRGKGCENRGGLNKLNWAEVKDRLDEPGIMAPGTHYEQKTFQGANEIMTFRCSKHGEFPMTPKQIYAMGHGCPGCGKERVGEAKRIPTDEIRTRLEAAQGGRHMYPHLETEHGHAGTGTETNITVRCLNGHVFTRTIESESLGAACGYCYATSSSQEEVEIAFEIGQFDESWKPFDTQVRGVKDGRLSFADMKFILGRVPVDYDGAYWHADRQDCDQRKSDNLLTSPETEVVYRIREDTIDGTPLPPIKRVKTLRVKYRSSIKEKADVVLRQLVQDGFLPMTPELGAYLRSDQPTRSAEARIWYSRYKTKPKYKAEANS